MRIAISAESTIDLSKQLLEEYNISTIPFTVLLGDKVAKDGVITPIEIIEYVNENNTLPKTSALNQFEYSEYFNGLLQNSDAVIHFSLSSGISSTCQNAKLAASEMKNVYVVDTLSLSTGIALQAIYASKLARQGLDPKTIVEKVEKRIPFDQTSFILSRLDFLYKGGRCNTLSYLSAALLKIRPQIVVKDGIMLPKKKYVGKMDKCVVKYVTDTFEIFNTPDLEEVFITSSTSTPEQVITVKNMLKERGFKNIHITSAGATITSHCGENCLGILYFNDGNEDGVFVD